MGGGERSKMRNLETATEEIFPTKKRKRRNSDKENHNETTTETPHTTLSPETAATVAAEEEEKQGCIQQKHFAAERGISWESLDFILSLQSKELNLHRKVELAFDFVNSSTQNKTSNNFNHPRESVQQLRLISFLNDWIQSLLISPEKKILIDGKDVEPCLDSRCWVVLKFCLEKSPSTLNFSTNLLRAVSRIMKEASLIEGCILPGLVSECIFLLFSSHGPSFNANIDAWASAATAALDLMQKIFSDGLKLSDQDADSLLHLSYSVLEQFANYLRVHPSPKNVFPVVVDRLVEPLLIMLFLLDHSSSARKDDSVGRFLKLVEDTLSNGLFHPAHIDGFLCIHSLEKYVRPDAQVKGFKAEKAVVKSYHKHLFHKLEQFVLEKKMSAMVGLGKLLLLFVARVKKQKGTVSYVAMETVGKTGVYGQSEHVNMQTIFEESVGRQSLISEEGLSSSRMDDLTSKSIFNIFVQFMEPLMFAVKQYSGRNLSEVGDCSEVVLADAHCTLKAVSKMLSSFLYGKLYVRTEDTSEGAHRYFLKEVYDTLVAFSVEICINWSSALKKNDRRYMEMLQLIAKEVTIAVGCFLEIEYEVLGNDLVGLWLMMLSYLAIDLSPVNAKHISQDILHLGCRFVTVYSDLRQVNNPIFALSKAVRCLISPVHDGEIDNSIFIPPASCLSAEMCVKSAVTLLGSQELRHAICTAIKAIPEGQASGCIQQLKIDLTESLEWMKISCSTAVGNESAIANGTNNWMLNISLRAELLGRGLSELYTFILDSLTVTTGNSIFVGNSMKDLMTVIQSSLGSLVQIQSDSLNEFVLSVTGRGLSTHEMPECETHLVVAECGMSFIFVFFFRMYASCRSLYRLSISLMPPDSSRKASVVMGDLFTAYSGKDWIEQTDRVDGGYFSWIIKPSTSLVAIVKSISDTFLQDNLAGYAPLVYSLHVMAFQRLVDLNRQINAFKYLQERDLRVTKTKLLDDAILRLSHKGIKKCGKHILVLKQEAVDLTNFITGYLSLIPKKRLSTFTSINGDFSGMDETESATFEDEAWDFGVCSLSEKSLSTALWWLLCQNTDVWCPHASKKVLKKFISLLFYHCMSSMTGFGSPGELNMEEPGCTSKIMLHHISLELLGDSVLYEETFLCRHLTSRFCHILKKLLLPLLCHHSTGDIDFNSLPEWSKVLSILETVSAVDTNEKQPQSDGCLAMGPYLLVSNRLPWEITACHSLLNFLCWMPKGYVKSQSSAVFATFVLNVERIVVLSLLNCRGGSFSNSRYELFKLLVSCRQALRNLALASGEGILGARQSPLIDILFGSSLSALWLLKSVSEVAGLLHSFCEEHFEHMKDMIFSLMDHTSNIFLTLSEGQMNAALQSQTYQQKPGKELYVHSDGNESDSVTEVGLNSDCSECFNAWKHLELIVETLRDQTKVLLETKFEGGINAINWNSLSSLISCFQGFLWGMASALNDVNEVEVHPAKWSLDHISEFILRTDMFADFVNVCLNMLLVDGNLSSQGSFGAGTVLDLDCMNEALNLQLCLRTVVETHGGEIEKSPGKQQDTEMADGIDDSLASDTDNENINSTGSGSKCIKISISKKRRENSVLALTDAYKIDIFEQHSLNRSLLRRLLKGEHLEVAFSLRQLFVSSSAILRLKHLLSSSKALKLQIDCNQSASTSMAILIGTSHFALLEFAEMVERPHPFSLVWLDGIVKYLEVLGGCFPLSDPLSTRNLYVKLIDIHIRAIGRCISLQGKAATLASHEIESSTKTLKAEEQSLSGSPFLGHGYYSIKEFKARLRSSFKMFTRKPLELHLLSAVQALERALVGVHEGCNVIYGINMGGTEGGKVSSVVAAGIDCLDLVLESVSGHKRLSVVKRHVQSLICALFNIVLHLQGPLIFSRQDVKYGLSENFPDPGSVVLMCVEVLAKIARKNSLFQMEPSHVSQSLHMPSTLFKHFLRLTASPDTSYSTIFKAKEVAGDTLCKYLYIVDRQFSINLYAACCRLLCTILRHRKSESERCIALLEDSVHILLYCLEIVDAKLVSKKSNFSWEVEEGIKCASFLRRIYEEIRQQKDILGKYSFHFLSNYISVYSGYGPLRTGIIREIDEALRPGLYALIDSCSPADLQQLHTVLAEGPCRSTLATLQHDYKLNFQYQGKI